jgi:hypothetical protein
MSIDEDYHFLRFSMFIRAGVKLLGLGKHHGQRTLLWPL